MKAKISLSFAIAVALAAPTPFALTAPALLTSSAPDLTGVWYHIRHKQTDLANAEFQRLKQKYPQWTPDEALSEALEALNRPPAPAKPIAPPMSEASNPQNKPDEMSLLMGQLANMNDSQWQTVSSDLIDRAEGFALTERNDDALLLMGWINMARQHFKRARGLFSEVGDNSSKARNDAIGAAIDALVFNAIAQNDRVALEKLFSASPVQTQPLLRGAAWDAFDNNAMDKANMLFSVIDERLGRVLSLAELHRNDEASTLACSTTGNPEVENWCNSALATQLVTRYENADYTGSIAIAEQLDERGGMTPALNQLYGWSLANEEQFSIARVVFGDLLKQAPDDKESQNALIHAYNYDAEALGPLAAEYPFVAEFIASQHGELAWGRKQFDLANRTGITRAKATVDSNLQAYVGLTTRHRNGLRGLGHLDEQAGYAGMSTVVDDIKIDLSVRHERLFSGTGAEGTFFGGGAVGTTFTGDTMQTGQGIEVDVTRQAKDWTGYANLGYLLFNQPVSTRFTGALGGTYFQPNWQLSIMGYRQRRKDSMLSQTGTHWRGENPFTTAWGGVLQTGMKGLGVLTLNDRWAVSSNFNFAALEGEGVKDNGTYSLRMDMSRDLLDKIDSEQFDYLRVGPYISWQKYDHDLSDFTLGQGGYFSPQRFVSAGASAELLSAEAQQWQIHSRLSLGWSSVYEEGGARFPLSPETFGEVSPSNQKGISADLFVEGQYQFASHWSVAGYISRSHAVAYQATFAGIELRWYAAPRRGVTSDTLFGSKPALKDFLF